MPRLNESLQTGIKPQNRKLFQVAAVGMSETAMSDGKIRRHSRGENGEMSGRQVRRDQRSKTRRSRREESVLSGGLAVTVIRASMFHFATGPARIRLKKTRCLHGGSNTGALPAHSTLSVKSSHLHETDSEYSRPDAQKPPQPIYKYALISQIDCSSCGRYSGESLHRAIFSQA